jgi:hypothetical protein
MTKKLLTLTPGTWVAQPGATIRSHIARDTTACDKFMSPNLSTCIITVLIF